MDAAPSPAPNSTSDKIKKVTRERLDKPKPEEKHRARNLFDAHRDSLQAYELKEEGNVHFKASDWKKALQKYHFAWLNIKGLGDNASALMK
jgi:hypothetical protein